MLSSVLLFLNLWLSTKLCSGGVSGVDLSVQTSASDWKCLVQEHNISFAIIRSYRSVGQIDDNCAANLKHASRARVGDLGVYIFPCIPGAPYSTAHNITCDSAELQVRRVLNYLNENDIVYSRNRQNTKHGKYDTVLINRVWLDIEDEVPSKYFDSNAANNQAFVATMVQELQNYGAPVGIYTTKTYWDNIMGNVEGYSQFPLWYPRYDGVDSFDFFAPFAGWDHASVKQTAGNSGFCWVTQVDSDYME